MKRLLASDKIYIKTSDIPHAGRGVFAAVAIKKGDLIERCPVIEIPQQDLANVSGSFLVTYFFSFGDHKERLVVALGFGSLYNHEATPNAFYKGNIDAGIIDFIALQDIAVDGEITVDYNPRSSKDTPPLWFIDDTAGPETL